MCSAAEVLHTRWIKLGNSSGSIEVLDRHCQTEGAGKHPLFEGVARATITGLPSKPRIEETDGAVEISEKGLTLTLRGARVTRDGQTVTITLASQPRSRREESPRGEEPRAAGAERLRGVRRAIEAASGRVARRCADGADAAQVRSDG
jgi:hypothetical protein